MRPDPISHAYRPATDSWYDELDALPPVSPEPSAPADQAQGLRRMFTSRTMRCIPVVSNPAIAFGGGLLERLCTAYAGQGLRTLVVDAADNARAPAELAGFDLTEGIEVLSTHVSYLAARGLALRFVDAHGSTSSFLDALAEAAPDVDVLLVHASAAELVRLFARRVQELQAYAARPIVLCDERPDSVTHAYTAIKLFATRAGLMSHDLMFSATPDSPRAAKVAERLARCADDFLGATLHDWVAVDPAELPTDGPSLRVKRLAREQLACAVPHTVSDSVFGALSDEPAGRAALPALAPHHGAHSPWSR